MDYGQGTCGAPSGSHVAQALALTEHDGCGQGPQASSFSLGAAGGARQREQQWEPCAPCPHLPTHSPDGKPEAAEASPAQPSVARTCCGRAPRLAGRLGLRALSRRALLSFATPPPLSPLSPCLLLLQLPRVVNSLKLLIKNILLSPPKVCFPVIFLLEGDMGGRGAGGGRWPRSGGQPSRVSMEGAEEPGPGCPLPHVTLPGFLAPWGGISEGSNPGCHGARNGASSPGPCAHSSHHIPQDRSRRPWPRPIFTGGRGPCLPVRVLLAPAASGSP